jgi:site-specific DNA recombinase
MTKMTRAFGYVRLSSVDEEERTTSPQRQRARIERLSADRGWELVETFEDIDVSAFNGKHRPGYERMRARLGEVDAIVFWRLDRLSRSVLDFSRFLDQTQRAGVQLVSTDQLIDTSSAMGKAFVQVTAVFAELEAGTTSERAKQMAAYKRERDEWMGQVPFGWSLADDKRLVPVPEQQAVLVKAATEYVAGQSLRKIAPSLGFTHANLARIFRSERVLDALPPDVAGRLVTEMADRGRTGTSATPSLLGGIGRCSVCGAAMTVVGQTTRRGRKPRGAYGCRERGHVNITKQWLDEYVSAAVLEAIDVDRLAKRMAKRKPQRMAMKVPELESRLALLEEDHYDRGMVPRDRFLRLRGHLLKQIAEAREAGETNTGPDISLDTARHLPEVWPTMSTAGRRQIIKALVSEIRISKSIGHGPIKPSRVEIVWR